MLRAIANFSKTIAKYSYYPLFLGFICLLAAIVNDGKALAGLCWFLFGVCAALSIFSFMSGWLCRKAGIDPKIR
jgi:hypothetical protein